MKINDIALSDYSTLNATSATASSRSPTTAADSTAAAKSRL